MLGDALTASKLPPLPVALDPSEAFRSADLAAYAVVMRATSSLVKAMLDAEVTVSEGEPAFVESPLP